ncbi:MAG: DUF116 domain-containing protein [Methanosarcinales archaeon]|jgi:hypothetical protein|nr:DUF116 domain-containing protein [Methanosarcinales archaeon]
MAELHSLISAIYQQIGFLIVICLILSIILLLLAFSIVRTGLKKNRFLSSYASNILDFFYKPLLSVYLFLYKSPDKFHKIMVNLKNYAHYKKFAGTKQRIVLAPHCMRFIECKAQTTRLGIQCTSCGKCDFTKLKKISEQHGYKLYIVTGSSLVRHILQHPDAKGTDGVLAIGCNYEINKGMRELKRTKITTYGIPLLSAGCYNTHIDLEEFERQLLSFEEAAKKRESRN